jgi:hypothetical protein
LQFAVALGLDPHQELLTFAKTFIGSLRLINPLVNVFHATFNAARREAPQVAGS